MADHMTTHAQFSGHTSIAIAGKLVLNVADKFDQTIIVQINRRGGGPVIVSAERQLNHLAPPSDRDGSGPLTIEDDSLLLTIFRRGFFTRSSSMVRWPTLRSSAAIF